MAEIVSLAKKGTSKTHIMFRANLSFTQLNQYISLLSETQLLEKLSLDGKEIYKATRKGLEFMEKQGQVIDFLNAGRHKYGVKTSFEFNAFPKNKFFTNELLK